MRCNATLNPGKLPGLCACTSWRKKSSRPEVCAVRRLPRDLDGDDLVKALRSCGYELTRQTGSHMRLITSVNGEHHVTVPKQSPLRVGTLSGILSDVVAHHGETRDELAARIFK